MKLTLRLLDTVFYLLLLLVVSGCLVEARNALDTPQDDINTGVGLRDGFSSVYRGNQVPKLFKKDFISSSETEELQETLKHRYSSGGSSRPSSPLYAILSNLIPTP